MALMRAGVTMIDPAATYVDAGVTVGATRTLYPGTLLRGATSVGAGCVIGPHTTISDTTIGDGARVRYALVERASGRSRGRNWAVCTYRCETLERY